MWGWPIVNFVFWIGIGHAGTLISAILFLTRQNWRTSINRAAEAMTIFAVMCAGIFPAFHVGRVWMAWFLAPIPNANAIWQNFKSPLLWDVFAVSTYFTISLIFWYLGMVPDLATIRDRCKPGLRKAALRHLLPRLARRQPPVEPLRDGLPAAGGALHPAGALGALGRLVRLRHLGGARLAHHHFPALLRRRRHLRRFRDGAHDHDPGRLIYGLQDLITLKHIDNMAKIILLTGTIVGYAYLMELFVAFYSGNQV